MYFHETKISEAIDFMRKAEFKYNTVKMRHRVLNIMWWLAAIAAILIWVQWLI